MISASLPRSLTIALLTIISIFASTVISQAAVLPTSGSDVFPACAVDCPILNEAQSSCQASPDNDRATLVSCFCQSSLLTTLSSTPQGVCDASCSSVDDLKQLQSWYSSFCASGGDLPGTGPTTSTTPDSLPTGGSKGSTGSSESSGSSGSNGPGHKSW